MECYINWCCRLFCASLCFIAPAARAATLFQDDFNAGMNATWSIVRPDATYYSIQPTYLDVRASNGDIWQWRTDAKNLFMIDNPTAGDFAVTLKVNSFTPTANYTQIDILAYDDDDNHVRAAYGHLDAQRRLDNASEITGQFSGHGLTAQDFGTSPFWLQLRKVGTLYSLFFSTDGTNYSPASSPHVYGDGTPAKLGFVAMVDPYQSTHALVDSFIVTDLGIAGDYNLNGVVDAADYVVWRKNEGTTNMLPNDLIGGTIGEAQYGQWRSHFSQTAGSGVGASVIKVSSAVPEPTSTLMHFMGLLAFGLRRRPAAP